MVQPPAGWRARRVDDGLLLSPSDGAPWAEIRYFFRRGACPLDEALAKNASIPGFVTASISDPERLVTDEGEYATLVVISGDLDNRPVRRHVGFVHADYYDAILVGVVVDESRFSEFARTFRTTLLSDHQMLGSPRRRTFRYAAPSGWRSSTWDLDVIWFPPQADGASLTVLPALPSGGVSLAVTSRLVQENLEGRFAVERTTGPDVIGDSTRLQGIRYKIEGRLDGNELIRAIVLMQDDRYVYGARLEAPPQSWNSELDRHLDRLALSIQPIPRPRRNTLNLDSLKHWTD